MRDLYLVRFFLLFSVAQSSCVTGEDALANLSIEKIEGTGQIQGHVRIRSKTQGIALSLGDKITLGEWKLDNLHEDLG